MPNHFYTALPSFQKFEELCQDRIYHSVPMDWTVVIADIESSTKAIQEGRYRDVNTLGAASIAMVQKVFGKEDFPFVFGGDGATFLIPPNHLKSVRTALQKLKSFAQSQFQLSLRIGLMSVEEIQQAGQRLEVAKFQIAGQKTTAFIRGGGLAWAEYQIKTSPRKYRLPPSSVDAENLFEGLSCRWQPLASRHGVMLTILVQPRFLDSTKIFQDLFIRFREILGGDFEASNPVNSNDLKYKSLWNSLKDEWKYEKNKFSVHFRKRLLEIILCQWAFRWKFLAPFQTKPYVSQISTHSDYRKYDDMLRLVLDCTPEQAERLVGCLQALHESGEVFFGISQSSHALMTCLVQSLDVGDHIHFIDGSEGGYTLAAQNLTAQILKARQAPSTITSAPVSGTKAS